MTGRRGKGEGSIYQRANGLWVGSVDLGWEAGKRKRKFVTASTRAEVARRLREFQHLVNHGVTPAPELLTVGQYLDLWLAERLPGTVSVRTEAYYAGLVERHLKPSIGSIRLNKLVPSDVSKMMAKMEAKGYAAQTRRSVRAALRRALRIAEQDGLLMRNVAAIAEGPKSDHREGRSFTPDQARTFLEAVKGHRLEVAYVLTLSLGLRRGEVLGISWRDIEDADDGGGVLSVRRQIVRDKSGLHTDELKTKGSRRTLHLTPPLMEMLTRHRAVQFLEAEALGDEWSNEHDLAFTSLTGRPLDVDAFGKSVPRICKQAGLGHWSIHELRHSCASLMLNEKVPLEVVSEQMGHTSIRLTKDVYGHLMPKSRKRAADAMTNMLFGATTLASPLGSAPSAVPMAVVDDAGVESETKKLVSTGPSCAPRDSNPKPAD